MGFLTFNRKRSRTRTQKELKLRVGTLRSLQEDTSSDHKVNKRRKNVENLYISDDTQLRKRTRRNSYTSSQNVIEDTNGALRHKLESRKAKQPKMDLISLPREIIHHIFLFSGNLEFPNCCKALQEMLTNSRYLAYRMVLNLSSTISAPKPSLETFGESADSGEEAEPPVRVLNSRFLIYKFVTQDALNELNILYTGADFPIGDSEEITESSIASVQLPSEFDDLTPNRRTLGLYSYLLAQPNTVATHSAVFINMAIHAGFLEEVHTMLDSTKIRTDEITMKLALENNDLLLFSKAAMYADPEVRNHDIIWENLLISQNRKAISILSQAGGNPSLHALSFGMSQQ